METTIFFSIISGLLLFVIGCLVIIERKIGRFDQFMINMVERIVKVEERLDLIDKLNGLLDNITSRLDLINHRQREKTKRVKR